MRYPLPMILVLAVTPTLAQTPAGLYAEPGGGFLPSSRRPAAPLAERFARPPAANRILKIVHKLPDEPEQRDALIRDLMEKGFGGMTTNVSFDDYLRSETKWQSFIRVVNEAKKAGLALWLYDERGYPSGNAGGITMRDHPEWEARGLVAAVREAAEGMVSFDIPPGKMIRALAAPVTNGKLDLASAIDLASAVHDGKLDWQAPAGQWRIIVVCEGKLYEGTHAAVSLADKLPYINLLLAAPTQRFLEVTHGEYARRLGPDLGAYFIATFTDEPSLMSLYMRPQPWVVLPWSDTFAGEFEKRRGYDVTSRIPMLLTGSGPECAKARYDFWLTVGELVSQNFFGQIQTWCSQHNVRSGGHLLCEESLLNHVPLYGDFYRCLRRLDAPSIDCLTSMPEEVPWHIARLISSVADLEGRPVTMCETSDHVQRYRPSGDQRPVRMVTEDEIRGTCNRLMLSGITTITSYYTFADLDRDALIRLNEWVGRCSTTLEGGRQMADVAVVYPVETLWTRFTPSREWTKDLPEDARAVEETYRAALEALFAARRDAAIIDSQAISECKAERGLLRHGEAAWRVLVLPDCDTLPLAAWETVARFWESGGVVIALGALPANSEREFPCSRVQAIAGEMFGHAERTAIQPVAVQPSPPKAGKPGAGVFLAPGMESLLASILDTFLEPDVALASDAPVRVTHRRIDGREVYFLINDSRTPWEGVARFRAEGSGEQFDPASGVIAQVSAPRDVPVKLGPFGGMLFRFPHAAQLALVQPKAPTFGSLDLPRLEKPAVLKGEFVDGKAEPATNNPDSPWRAEAVLTKGEVDTFLFLGFDFASPADVSGAEYVLVETEALPPQSVPAKLYVILVDREGREFFVRTGYGLDQSGPHQCYLPLKGFERAMWETTPEGNFNWSAVASIRVGWGGYYGREGERLAFRTTLPIFVRVVKPAK